MHRGVNRGRHRQRKHGQAEIQNFYNWTFPFLDGEVVCAPRTTSLTSPPLAGLPKKGTSLFRKDVHSHQSAFHSSLHRSSLQTASSHVIASLWRHQYGLVLTLVWQLEGIPHVPIMSGRLQLSGMVLVDPIARTDKLTRLLLGTQKLFLPEIAWPPRQVQPLR